MQLSPYLIFNGNCREAFAFYEQLFGGRIVHLGSFGDMPDCANLPEAVKNNVMHVNLQIGQHNLMGSDAMPGAASEQEGGYQTPKGMHVSFGVPSLEEGQRVFDGLAQGGKIVMPFGKTFWSPGFGMVTDRFAIPWMVNVAPA